MNKILTIALASSVAIGFVSCKKGTLTGKVVDPFTNQPVTNATVWVDNTPLQAKAADGSFNFEKVDWGDLKINAGKNKCSKTHAQVSVTEQNPAANVTLYIFSKEDVEPGLYNASTFPMPKIANAWLNWESTCKETLFAYRKSLTDAKTKKEIELPDFFKSASTFKALIYQQSSAVEDIIAKSYPLSEGNVADHKDCSGFGPKETVAYFPVQGKVVELSSTYKSDMLYEVSGELPKGKQALAFFQGGKVVKTYLLNVQ